MLAVGTLIQTEFASFGPDSGFLHVPPAGAAAGLALQKAVRDFVRRTETSLKNSTPVQITCGTSDGFVPRTANTLSRSDQIITR